MLAQILYKRGSVEVTPEDLVAVGLLVILEAILSADNAIVLALLAYSLPKDRQKVALKIGIWCAFILRILAVLFLIELLKHNLTKMIALGAGGGYLLWLPVKHFREKHKGAIPQSEDGTPQVAAATTLFGMSIFWSTVARIEFTDIVFSVDSILVAMATSPKAWVIITGGIMGIIAMRFVAGGFLKVIERFPSIVDGAYLIVAIAGLKMLIELAHTLHWVHLDMQIVKWISFGLILVIFASSLMMGRRAAERKAAGDADAGSGEAAK